MPDHAETEALYRALNSPLGVILRTNDPDRLRQKLYRVRKNLSDPDLDRLRFTTSRTNPESELLIINTGGKNAENG